MAEEEEEFDDVVEVAPRAQHSVFPEVNDNVEWDEFGVIPKEYVPVLDLNDEQHPLLLTAHSAGRADASPTAKQLRNDAFQLALYNGHPGLRAHEYRSTIIENWMRGL